MIIELYPENCLEGLIAREWVSLIVDECREDSAIEPNSLSKALHEVLMKHRELMTDAGWPQIYQHAFLKQLRNDLTALTHGHPVTRQFVDFLTAELEQN